MADQSAPSVGSSVKDIVKTTQHYLPAWSQALMGEDVKWQDMLYDMSAQSSPKYNALQNQLMQDYLGPMASSSANALNAADLESMQKYGVDMASAARQAEAAYNPDYASTRSLTSDKLGELLGSINLNDPSAEAERYISQESRRSGNANTGSQTETLSNALSFGKEADARRNQLSQAISAATQFLPTAAGQGFNVQAATAGKGSAGLAGFLGVQSPQLQGSQTGQGLLNAATGTQTAAIGANASDGGAIGRSGLGPIGINL